MFSSHQMNVSQKRDPGDEVVLITRSVWLEPRLHDWQLKTVVPPSDRDITGTHRCRARRWRREEVQARRPSLLRSTSCTQQQVKPPASWIYTTWGAISWIHLSLYTWTQTGFEIFAVCQCVCRLCRPAGWESCVRQPGFNKRSLLSPPPEKC